MKNQNINPESEWFGYENVTPEEKTERVNKVFSSVADDYDLMNDLMSFGLHRLWKNKFVSQMNPKESENILDVAGGTGDIARRCLQSTKGKAHITVCDLNEDMMRIGRKRTIDEGFIKNINWVVGNAEKLPIESESMDLVCISFGLRNITNIDDALSEFFRVLKPTGRFYCMEFTPNVTPSLKNIYDLYSFSILPWLGESYEYLAQSIRKTPSQENLKKRMEVAKFEQIHWKNIMGGIVAIHSGWKL